MREHPLIRVGLICLLLGLVGWQLVDYAAAADDRAIYPTSAELDRDFERYHGAEIEVWLTVAERTDEGFRATNGWTVTLAGPPGELNPGDDVFVYGIARPGPGVEAERIAVSERRSRQYMFAVSSLALVLAAVATLCHWRPSVTELYLVPRAREADRGRERVRDAERGRTEVRDAGGGGGDA